MTATIEKIDRTLSDLHSYTVMRKRIGDHEYNVGCNGYVHIMLPDILKKEMSVTGTEYEKMMQEIRIIEKACPIAEKNLDTPKKTAQKCTGTQKIVVKIK